MRNSVRINRFWERIKTVSVKDLLARTDHLFPIGNTIDKNMFKGWDMIGVVDRHD